MTRLTARWISRSFHRQGITEETLRATLTIEAVCVINASKAFSSGSITVSDRIWVHVIVAIALLTWTNRTSQPLRISEITIFTFLASRSYMRKMIIYRKNDFLALCIEIVDVLKKPNLPLLPSGHSVQTGFSGPSGCPGTK